MFLSEMTLNEYIKEEQKLQLWHTMCDKGNQKIKSSEITDENIPSLELTKVLIKIRKCQILCKQSQRATFIGSMQEFAHAHQVLDRVTSEKPVQTQKILIIQMRKLAEQIDVDLLARCSDYADKVTCWNSYF